MSSTILFWMDLNFLWIQYYYEYIELCFNNLRYVPETILWFSWSINETLNSTF